MWMLTEYFTVIVLLVQLGRVHLEPLGTNIPKKSFIVETNDEMYAAYLADIIEALSSSSSNDAGQYVLQPFSESDVPIPIISNSLADIQELVRSLDVEDSQNCSTHGLNSLALYSGLNSSASNSLVVVLSGTSAKSDGTFIPEILDLIQKKQLRVIFLVSDECTEDDIDDGLRLMEQISEVSSGLIFSLDLQNISQVIRFIQTFDYGEDVSLISPTLSSPGVSSYALNVDDSVEQLLVILSGLEPIISIADVEGKKLEEGRDFEYIVDSNKLQIIFLENVIPGEYATSVFSSSDSLVQVIGFAPSPMDVRYRFYYKKTVDMTEATERPYTVQGSYNFMLMQIENAETNEWYAHEMIQEVEFVSLIGEVLPKYSFSMGSSNFVTQEGANNAHYVLQMQPPQDHFYIRIRGVTKNQPFQRSSKVAYSQWRPVPTQPSSFIVFEFEDCDYDAIWYEPKHIFTKSLIGYQFSFGAETDTAIDFQLPSNVTSYRVKQLAKGLTYVFTVAAINEAGVGEAISVTVVTPTDKPRAPPTNIRLIQTTESLIEIAWQPPMADSRGGNIIGYTTIHYRMSEPWKRYRFNTSKSHVVFKKMRPNTEYGFQIAARTIIGQGPYSHTAVFKTQSLVISSSVSPVQTQTTIQPHIDTDEPNVDIDSALQGPSELKSVDQQQNEQKSNNMEPDEQTQKGQLNVTTDKPNVDEIDNTELEATVIPVDVVTIMDGIHSSLEQGSPTPSSEKAVSDTSILEGKLATKVEAHTDSTTMSPVSAELGNNPDGDITRNDISDVKTVTQRSGDDVVRGDVEEYDGSSYTNNSLSRIIAYPVNDQGETEPNHGGNGGSFITLEKKLADVTQPVNGRAVFLCRIKGSPTVNYSWYLDNEIIDVQTSKRMREKMIPHRGMRLTIRDLTLIDQGVYTCRGENEFGKIETSAVLNVRFGPTGIVTDLQALIVSSNAVTIKWFPPLLHPSDGPLLNYAVYIYKLSLPSETYKFETNVTELVYENLEASTEYVFSVRAVTSKGKGPYSSIPVKTTAEDVDKDSEEDKQNKETVDVYGDPEKPVDEDKVTDNPYSEVSNEHDNTNGESGKQVKIGQTDSKDVETEVVDDGESHKTEGERIMTTTAATEETRLDESAVDKSDTTDMKEESDNYPIAEPEKSKEEELDSENIPQPEDTEIEKSDYVLTTPGGEQEPQPEPITTQASVIDKPDSMKTEEPVDLKSVTNGMTENEMAGGTSEETDSKKSEDVVTPGDSTQEAPPELAEDHDREKIDERPELEITVPYDIDSGAEAITDTPTQNDVETTALLLNTHLDDIGVGHSIGPNSEQDNVTKSMTLEVEEKTEATYDEATTVGSVVMDHKKDSGNISVANGDSHSLPVDTNGDKLTVELGPTTTENIPTDDVDNGDADKDDHDDEIIDETQQGESELIDEVPHMTVAAPLQHRIIDYNGKATLRCFVTGYPPPFYEWYHEGKRIPVVRGRIKDRVFGWGSRIIIKNITEADRGRYTCVAKNSAGERTLEGSVTVKGVAKVEDIQVIIMSPTEALVDWKAPSYIAPGSTYIVRFYTEDNRALKYHFSTTRTEAYYRNLIPNMAYTFRVKMQRGNRLSVFSDPITVRTFPLGPKDTDGTTEISPEVTKNIKTTSHTNIESTTSSIDEEAVSIIKSTKDQGDVDKQPTSTVPSPEEVGMTTKASEEDIPVETTTELAESMLVTKAPIPNVTEKDMIPSTLPEVAMDITTSPVLTTDTPKESTTAPLKINTSDGMESTTVGREVNPADSGTTEPPVERLMSTTDAKAQTSVKAEDVDATHKNNEPTRKPAAEDYLRLIKPLESITATVGERVLLRCLVEAKPQATFLWHKDGNPLETSRSKVKQKKFLKGSMLTFKSISMSDAGMYTCIALNSNVVETSGNITVIPKDGMQKTTQEPEPGKSHTVMKRSVRPEDGDKPVSHASTGTYTTLLPTLMEEAFVTPDADSPKITTVSQHDPQVVAPDNRTVVVRVTGIDPEKVDEADLGSLNARPSQTWDSSRRDEPYVEIKKYMDDQSVEVGDRVVLLCRIIGDPKPRFLWYKDSAPLVFDDSRMKERVLEIGSRFTIKRTLSIDAGVYTCYGLNDYQTVSMRATLEVSNSPTYVSPYSYPRPSTTSPKTKPTKPRTKPPAETTSLISYQPTDPFTPQSTKSYTKQPDCIGEISKLCITNELVGKKVDINDRISLRCQIYGDPQPEYRWYRNNERVYPSKLGPIREKVFPWGSRLAFRGAQESDTGEYRCLAINAAGTKDTQAWLLVGPYATIPPKIETEPPTTTVNVQTTPAKTKPPKKTPKPTVTRPPKRTTPRIEPTEVFLPSTTPNPNAKVKCISGSNGELCYANMQNQVGETGGYVVFSCRITGSPEPSYTWFKDGVLIVLEDVDEDDEELQRIRIKTLPWGSRLVIKGVRYSDAGTYFCVGSNVVSHIIQADLKVVQGSTSKPRTKPSKPKPSKPKTPKTPKPPKPKTPKPNPSRPVEDKTPPPVYETRTDRPDDGRCVVYTGSTCRRYLKSQMVYIDGGVDVYSIDTQLQATLQTLSAVDMQCINYLEPFLCFKAFPLCRDYSSRKSLCQEDCSVLTRSYCRDLTDLKAVYPGQYLWMPSYEDCRSLPSVRQDSDCTSVGLTNSNNNKSPTEGTKPAGKCKPYNTDGICSEYVGSRNTFIKSGFTLESIETTVMSIFTAALTLGSVSRECSNYLLPYICLRALPPCNRNGRPLEVCREDCDVLSNDICREDFKSTLASDSVDNSLFMLNDCLSLPSETGKYSCTTLSISGEFRATQTDVVFPTSPQPTRNCEPYKGTVCSKYLSGRTIYLDRGQSQTELEAEVSKVQQFLAREADMETTCENYLFKEICFNMLPVCNSRGKKREICREECSQLHNDYCYKDYRTLQVLLRGRDDVLAKCSALPRKSEIRGPTCVEVGVASLPQVPPQVEVDLEMDSNERQTSIVTLRCRVTGSPRPTVEWTKDGDTLESTNTIRLERNKVRIRVVSEKEAGTYTCTARNSGGSDHQNMLIELV